MNKVGSSGKSKGALISLISDIFEFFPGWSQSCFGPVFPKYFTLLPIWNGQVDLVPLCWKCMVYFVFVCLLIVQVVTIESLT